MEQEESEICCTYTFFPVQLVFLVRLVWFGLCLPIIFAGPINLYLEEITHSLHLLISLSLPEKVEEKESSPLSPTLSFVHQQNTSLPRSPCSVFIFYKGQ